MTVRTGDNFFQEVGGLPDDNEVVIAVGDTVVFVSPIAEDNQALHNVAFTDEAQPSVCNQTVQSPESTEPLDVDGVAPIPAFTTPPGWEGYCTFNAPGVYSFFCQVHAMDGTVTVVGTGPTPTPTASSTPTPSPTPTPTPPAGPRISAHDSGTSDDWFQDASSSDPSDNSITVVAGARVTFDFPAGTGTRSHNVVFPSSPAPTTCVQTVAGSSGFLDPDTSPPMPLFALPSGWVGSCDFPNPGTYSFVCGAHPTMVGTVIVEPVATPTPTPSPTPTATPIPPTEVPTPVTGAVGTVLAIQLSSPTVSLGRFTPGLEGSYDGSVGALLTSTSTGATFSVADVANGTGRLVNGSAELISALQVRAANAAQPDPPFASLTGAGDPLTLLAYGTWFANDPVAITFRQPIGATEPLTSGTYTKQITFTLSSVTP